MKERPAIAVACVSALAFLALAWVVYSHGLLSFDMVVREAVHRHASPVLTAAMRGFSLIGSNLEIWPLLAAVSLVLFRLRRRAAAASMIAAMAGGGLLEGAVKLALRRHRPDPYFGTELPGSYSFPSGHAVFAVAMYGAIVLLIARRNRLAWLFAILMIAAIGYSRIYLGVHYPSDVLGGYLLGIAWVSIVFAIYRRRGGDPEPEMVARDA